MRTARALAALLGLLLCFAPTAGANPPDAIEVCHRPPGGPANYRTLVVAPNALNQHLAHGDLLGACSTQCQALCDDGNLCTTDSGVWDATAERCTCSNPAVACVALDQCHDAGVCDAGTGVCSNPPRPDGSACDDANPLSVNEQCQAGVCEGGVPAYESCRKILDAQPGSPDGIYPVLLPPASTRAVFCDMTTDGGGWTASFIGSNGSPNVFDHFDAGAYTGAFDDPASGQYLQRAPTWLGDTASDFAVSCGAAMVKFPLTTAARHWLVDGGQSSWQPLTPTVVVGTVNRLPNWLYTGVANTTSTSFIFTRDQFAGWTFAASDGNFPAFDRCNGTADTTSLVRVFYREGAATPVRNTPEAALPSCRAILEAQASADDGIYWLAESAGTPYQAYCDMMTDGGGWTAVFAGRNGSVNVFDQFDAAVHVGTCTDPATRCLRRAPASLADANQLAVSCADAMVKFPLTAPVRNWLSTGTQAGWQPLVPTVIDGTASNPPNGLFTGFGVDESFVFALNQGTGLNTFASSYDFSPLYDSCNGVFDRASLTRVFYR